MKLTKIEKKLLLPGGKTKEIRDEDTSLFDADHGVFSWQNQPPKCAKGNVQSLYQGLGFINTEDGQPVEGPLVLTNDTEKGVAGI